VNGQAPLLEVEALRAGYGAVTILHGLSLTVLQGSVTVLVGANGAGKTTLMRTLAGVLPVQSGRLRLRGSEIAATDAAVRVEAGLTLVPEGRLVFPTLSVAENLRLGAIAPRTRPAARARLEEMWRLFPRLLERRDQAAGSLSGGEQQMLAIARGLMAAPTLLLLDEPTLGLSPAMARQIFETIASLRDRGLTILLAEQDLHRALRIADTAFVIENGVVALQGSGASLLADERVRAAYLGGVSS
jgi:branched-chain amino acid transport system ATP-binding protein